MAGCMHCCFSAYRCLLVRVVPSHTLFLLLALLELLLRLLILTSSLLFNLRALLLDETGLGGY